MPSAIAITLAITLAIVLVVALLFCCLRTYLVIRHYTPHIRRIFVESPLFNPARGSVALDSEDVQFKTSDGLTLHGSYLRTLSDRREGIIVFCHEFRADRWSGEMYWEFLRNDGFDIFTFDFRNHGTSDTVPDYTARHWLTEYELLDLEAALNVIHRRKDTDGLSIGLFGVSRGGSAALLAAARNKTVRAVVTDGAFPTHGTVRNYMRKWLVVYSDNRILRKLPNWYFGFIRDRVLSTISRESRCGYPNLERVIRRITPRPVFMIHGGRDGYIRPEIARELFEHAREPREFWLVKGARHNAALEIAGDEYRERVQRFFRTHLIGTDAVSETTSV